MAEVIAAGVAEEVAGSLISDIWREIQYPFKYKTNIKNLNKELKRLYGAEGGILLEVENARRNALVIGPNVTEWLETSEDLKKQIIELRDSSAQMSCICCMCPNLKSRYVLSKDATTLSDEVIKHLEKGKFDKIGHKPAPVQLFYSGSEDFSASGSWISTRNAIIDTLKEESTTVILIYGSASEWQKAMANEIASIVIKEKLFKEVPIANVSKNRNIMNVQDQLAAKLGMTFLPEDNVYARAQHLCARLINDENKILVILDDICEAIEYEEIGIPPPGSRNGLKVILTSKSNSYMKAQKSFDLRVLAEKEKCDVLVEMAVGETAELLGAASVSTVDGDISLHCLEEDVTNVTPKAKGETGHALKNISSTEELLPVVFLSNNAEETNEFSDNSAVHSDSDSDSDSSSKGLSIFMKYNFSISEEAKLLLLYCSLFPGDFYIPLEYLVRHGPSNQIFNKVERLTEVRFRIHSIVYDLVSCHLLQEDQLGEHVKLPYVVRNEYLPVATKDKGSHDRLHGWTEVNGMSDRILELKQYADSYKGNDMNYMGTDLGTSLRSLCLDYCTLESGLVALEGLTRLEVLSFYGSTLHEFPKEIFSLTNLKSLDLRFKKGPSPLPMGLLSGLTKLEELYLGSYFQLWLNEAGRLFIESDEGYVEDVCSLYHLTTFEVCTFNLELLLKFIQVLNLWKFDRFYLYKARRIRSHSEYQFNRSLNLQAVDHKFLAEPAVRAVIRRSDFMVLSADDLEIPLSELDEEGFISMKRLHLDSCSFQYVIDPKRQLLKRVFPNLVVLVMKCLPQLIEICHGDLPPVCFGKLQSVSIDYLPKLQYLWRGLLDRPSLTNLKDLTVTGCAKLAFLFPQSIIKCLVQLERISASDCARLEVIVSGEERNDVEPLFPKLRYLKVVKLPVLESIFSRSFRIKLQFLAAIIVDECSELSSYWIERQSVKRLKNVDVKDTRIFYDENDEEVQSWIKDYEANFRCMSCSFLGSNICGHLEEEDDSDSDNSSNDE